MARLKAKHWLLFWWYKFPRLVWAFMVATLINALASVAVAVIVSLLVALVAVAVGSNPPSAASVSLAIVSTVAMVILEAMTLALIAKDTSDVIDDLRVKVALLEEE